jgi:oligopeptide transport system ATP-binding protein
MRQRVMIAMALVTQPNLLIADEPTTALDVTIQAQIIELMKRLQEKMGMSIILITHDLGVVADIADEIIVMYAGKIVERGTCREIFYDPQHPYTWALLQSVPRILRNLFSFK